MAQYQHLPIYKATYDLLLRVTEVTRHCINLARHAQRHGLRVDRALTKAIAP
jgi:hypothetical protein